MRLLMVFLLMASPPQTPPAQISTRWSAVEALQAGTRVLAEFPNGQRTSGTVDQVSDDDLIVHDGGKVHVLHRRDIVAVSVREPAGVSTRAAAGKGAAIGAAAAAVFAIFGYAAHGENHQYGALEAEIVLGGAALGAAAGAATKPKPIYRDRLIYVRQ